MNGPTLDQRFGIYALAEELRRLESDQEAEERLDQVLAEIEYAAAQDALETGAFSLGDWDLGGDEAMDVVAAVDAGAGLASAAVAAVYAPASPWPRRLAGWAKSITKRLRSLAQMLLGTLKAAARALGAVSWSIGVSFPWGISVSIGWN